MKIKTQFMTTGRTFTVDKTLEFPNQQAAFEAVKAHYEKHGFTNFKLVDDQEYDQLRVTATTPGGRAGRNVAFIDYAYDDEYVPEGQH